MKIFKEIEPLRAFLHNHKDYQPSIGFVPTMGALHEGHLSLIRKAASENDLTVCSIFVNPTQFNNPIDLEKYPRTWEADLQALEAVNCHVLFAPESTVMYEKPGVVKFDFGSLDKEFEGKFRPGHFSGVALVVAKLFHIVEPTHAYFGQKDYQQFLIVSKLVEELKFNLKLTCFPTVRETTGLAMSSRNKRLSVRGRQDALILFESLKDARKLLNEGKSWGEVRSSLEDRIRLSGVARLEYLALADRENLFPIENVTPENLPEAILLIAAYVEDVRLIDNLFVAE